MWIIWEAFTSEWLTRSRRKGKGIDIGDRFLCLWIAFNGWMRGKYGEECRDSEHLTKTKQNDEFKDTFNILKDASPSFSNRLNELEDYSVMNMKFPDRPDKMSKYDGSFESLIEVIYNVRCNLFHGRKNLENNSKDYELVILSYYILRQLFNEYLKRYEPQYTSLVSRI